VQGGKLCNGEKNGFKNPSETWKEGKPPSAEQIYDCSSLEEVMLRYFKSPNYGTRSKIKDLFLIKAILKKIDRYTGWDLSHYNGYDPKIEKNAKKEIITLDVDATCNVLKNGKAIACNLLEPAFDGMRINVYAGEIGILFDFFYPDEGYRKKCVNFRLKQKIPLTGKRPAREANPVFPREMFATTTKSRPQMRKEPRRLKLFR